MPEKSTTCPHCERTSHYDMDVFFKWCAACKVTYSEVTYENWERAELGSIHQAQPDLTLQQVVDSIR